MYKKVDTGLDFVARENDILKFWKENRKKQQKQIWKHNKAERGCKSSLFFFVRRTGMTKPPVQLGVGKNTLV